MDFSDVYSESTQNARVAEVPLSHVSIEVGHFLMTDLDNGIDKISAQFQRMVPLLDAFTAAARAQFGQSARVSTCFLVDDYFRYKTNPGLILGKVLGTAEECGLTIDYLAREAGCARTLSLGPDGRPTTEIDLAELVAARLVPEPARESTGQRPPVHEGGWLCNGERSSAAEPAQAMRPKPYRPPVEFGRRDHSVFLDIELWSDANDPVYGEKKWSCPFLATVWQLLRLGMLRYRGTPVVEQREWTFGEWPDRWWDMPSLIKLNPHAHPFAAYRALSILPRAYIGVEHSVQLILDHLALDAEVTDKIVKRGANENVKVPREASARLEYMFLDGL